MRWPSWKVFLLLSIFTLAAIKTNAQEGDYPPIAAYGVDNRLWVYQAGKDPKRLTEAETLDYPRDLAWSPDGKRLAFRSNEGWLIVFNLEDDTTTGMIGYPLDKVPFAFTMASDGVLFGVDGGADGSMGPSYLDITLNDLETGLPTGHGLCCIERSTGYGASFDYFSPPTRVLHEEHGWHPSSWARFLEDTPFGILHSSLEGLQLDGETIWPTSDAVLSPDRTRVALPNVEVNGKRISYVGGIAILNLASQEHITFQMDAYPSSLGWGGDNVLFYARAESMRDLYAGLSEDEKLHFKNQASSGLEPDWPPYLSYNQVYIHQLNLTDGTDEVIYQTEAYTISRLMPSPDGREIYFSTIPNMDEWLETVLKSEISCNNYECIRPLFLPSLYRLDVASGEVELIGVGLYHATINFGADRSSS